MKSHLDCRIFLLLVAGGLFGTHQAVAQPTITFDNLVSNVQINPAFPTHVDVTDYSPTGLNLGTAGFWFPNFDASLPSDGAVDANHANSLPSWVVPNFDPNDGDYSFGSAVFSRGGHTSWSTITLPDGTTGLSGAILDPETMNNSNNSIPRLWLGAGTPPDFWMHIVTDNTNNENNPAARLNARGEDVVGATGNKDIDLRNLTFNGIPDVYSFRYRDWQDGDLLKVRLNSGVATIEGSIAGIMFDVIPEPSGIVLLGLGTLMLSSIRRRI